MKRSAWLSSLAVVPVILLAAPGTLRAQPVVYVDADAPGADDGTSWIDAYTDLQSVFGSGQSLEVWVAEGTYYPGAAGDWEASFALESGVALYGGFAGVETSRDQRDPAVHQTILSGDIDQNDVGWYPDASWNGNQDNVFHVVTASGVDPTAVLDGFIIERGSTNYGGHTVTGGDLGSGLYILGGSPTVASCVFRWNAASFGGAVYKSDGEPTFTGCTFTQNLVWWYRGAGICNTGSGGVTLADCRFLSNLSGGGAGQGGGAGLFNDWGTTATLTRCEFTDNVSENFYASGDYDGAYGAAVYNLGDGVTLVDCTFRRNFSHAGSGVHSWGADLTMIDCLFTDNTAVAFPGSVVDYGDYGGALACLGFSDRTTTAIGCVFVGNSAGEGGAIFAGGVHRVSLQDSIVWDNEATGAETSPIDGGIKGNVDVLYSCVQWLLDPIPGEDPPNPADFPGSHDLDPLFVDLPGRDLHLGPGSPCIDSGDNTAFPPEILADLDGNPRFFDDPGTPDTGNGTAPIVDMGAFEFGSFPVAAPSAPAAVGGLDLSVGPNPSSGRVWIRWSATASPPEGTHLLVLDAQGRRVAVFPLAGHGESLVWEGRDGHGRDLPGGVYFIQARIDGGTTTRKLYLIR